MNRQNYQQIGLVIALIIAGVSLPTSIISLTQKPIIIDQTVVENHYYNDTIIETYNNTIIINNTEYIPINRTIDYYHFDSVEIDVAFLNLTYNISTSITFLLFVVNTSGINVQAYKDGIFIYQGLGVLLLYNASYYVEFWNYSFVRYNVGITIELITTGLTN